MNDPRDRIVALSTALHRAADARTMASTDAWASAWDKYERELVERLIACEPDEDLIRFRLAEAIKAARQARRTIEHEGAKVGQLEKELELLEGRKPRAIA